jgi:dihydroneopterin aldolase
MASVVEIKNLQLPYPIQYPNVWGITKEQPGLLNITLHLKPGFANAADHDSLEGSVNYGNLSKDIRNSMPGSLIPQRLLAFAGQRAMAVASLSQGANPISMIISELRLPKASMTGDGLNFTWTSNVSAQQGVLAQRKMFAVQNMHLMALIGVNDYERTAKQPIIASMDFYYFSVSSEGGGREFPMEKAVVVEQRLQKVCQSFFFFSEA